MPRVNAPAAPLVVQVVNRLDVGGLENGVVNLVNRMPLDRYRNVVLCAAGFGESFRTRVRPIVPVLTLDKKPGKDFGAYGRAFRVLRQLRPSIVHTRNIGTIDLQWIAWAAGVGCRIHSEHGWEAADPGGSSRRGAMIRRLCRPVIDQFITMSADLAAWLRETVRLDASRIEQVYSGVDVDRFTSDGPKAMDHPWDHRCVVVGTVGRLDPVKNQQALVRGVAAVLGAAPALRKRVRLLIAGDGPLRSDLEQLSRDLGLADICWFAGRRSDVPDIMRSIDVFVLPSLNEGISNTILEAMATGRPVVATRVGGNPEVVTEGLNGFLVGLDEPEALARTLSDYVIGADLRERHGRAGRALALERFSLEAMVQRYMDLYDRALARAT